MRLIFKRSAALGLAASLAVSGLAGTQVLRTVAGHANAATATSINDWPRFGNTSDNTRYSQLTQINTSNVGKLGIAWTAQEGPNLATFETYPVVVNGIMYYTTNSDQVRAVNAATGKLMWQYTPKVDFYHAIAGGGGGVPTNRGVEVINGHVYLLTFDDQLIALQASTGEKLFSTQVADPNMGYSETSPPTYWNGLLFVGSAESDAGLRGFVAAYDATTGKQVWRFYTVPDVGQGWMPKVGEHGGGDVWMPDVVDTKTGILYFGTGNPSPDLDNSQRPGCDPWVNALVALDARTGKFKWAHTEVCNDVWDYDSHQAPMIFDVHMPNGKTVHAIGHGDKPGIYFVYDAATGKVLGMSHVAKYSMPHLKPTAAGTIACPGAEGGFEYSPPAYSPTTQYAYEAGIESCMKFILSPVSQTNLHKHGAADFAGLIIPEPNPSGFMAAINGTNGKVAWKTPMPKPMMGGAAATAGGLVFSGSEDGNFYAFDAKSGKILWKANLGVGFGAAPITYSVNGTQYVAIAAGGASAISAIFGTKAGGTLVVFKLNGGPIHTVPVLTTSATQGVNAAITTKGLTQINKAMYIDAKQQRVVINITAAATADNNGFNFNGYAKGAANYIVPAGWNVDWIFSNKSGIPHSAAVVPKAVPGANPVTFGLTPGSTPDAMKGIGSGAGKQYVGFPAIKTGKFYLVCLVPGHIQAGMWDYFTISTTAKMPSLQVMGKNMTM